jgi:predicted Zn-dependent peptidase
MQDGTKRDIELNKRDFTIQTEPPQPTQVRNAAFPEIAEARLPNGLRVLAISDYRLPRTAIRLGLRVGRVHGPEDNLALPPLTLELMQEGTSSRSSEALSEELDHFAIQLSSEALMEFSVLSAIVLHDHLEKALELMADVVLSPSFAEEELMKLKTRWRSDLISLRSQPGFLARERTFETIYPRHPYRRVSIPMAHLDAITRERVVAFYEQAFSPDGAFLVFSGPLELHEAVSLATDFFGVWPHRELRYPDYPGVQPLTGREVRVVHRPHSVQSRIMVSGRMPARRSEELMVFRLANQVFGGGASSRLFLNLREDKGYTYGAYSALRAYREDGLFLASADVKGEVTLPAIEEVLKEVALIREAPPLKKELTRSKAELIGSFTRQMETSSSIGHLELNRRMFEISEDYFTTFVTKMNRIGENEVHASAQRYFDPERVVITVVGDLDSLGDSLHAFGPVQTFDADGKLIG